MLLFPVGFLRFVRSCSSWVCVLQVCRSVAAFACALLGLFYGLAHAGLCLCSSWVQGCIYSFSLWVWVLWSLVCCTFLCFFLGLDFVILSLCFLFLAGGYFLIPTPKGLINYYYPGPFPFILHVKIIRKSLIKLAARLDHPRAALIGYPKHADSNVSDRQATQPQLRTMELESDR